MRFAKAMHGGSAKFVSGSLQLYSQNLFLVYLFSLRMDLSEKLNHL